MSESRDAANSDVLCDKTGTVMFKNVKKPSDAAGSSIPPYHVRFGRAVSMKPPQPFLL